jgi:ATP-binding cassette subfamily F protein uup
MSLVSLHHISIAFGGPALLDDVSLDIQKGQRICFLGRNGAGKSTFMKIIAGETVPDAGDIITEPGVKIAYLPQDIAEDISGTVFDVVASGAGESGAALALVHALTAHDDPARMHELHHYLDQHNGWRIQTVIERVLENVGLDGSADFASLSGGMRRRTLLARALVHEPDLLLLDEPTNHLDIESIARLESFILGSKLTVLFVTHDRRLLRRLATRIIEFDRAQLIDWSCDYETFLSRRQAVLDAEEKEWARFDKKLAREEVWIRRGIRARRTRNEGRVRALMAMRNERRKRRERSGVVAMAISAAQRSGERVMEATGLCFSYGAKPVVRDLTTCIMRGDSIGIMGPNGCGKTTLLNLLLGTLRPERGTIAFGARIAASYFDQLRAVLDPEKTVWENLSPTGGDTVFINGAPRHIVSYLQDFLFTSDRAHSPVRQLSGGERNRLVLARLFTQPANVLVFDEPTNDLDAETLDLLEELLMNYSGTVLVVSHDREFLNNVVTAMLVYMGDARFKEYIGGYDDWERQTQNPAIVAPQTSRTKKPPQAPTEGPKKNSYKEQRELELLPAKIEALEREQEQLNLSMADSANYEKPGFVAKARERLAEIEAELTTCFARWEELEARPK